MNLPEVVSRSEWVVARKKLLDKEKALTRQRDELNADRRRLPMVRVDDDYSFVGPEGRVRLVHLFEGHRQLIVHHFMFAPGWDEGCPGCAACADEISEGLLDHLNDHGTALAFVSRASWPTISRYLRRKGWVIPWYSSYGSGFNYDLHVTLDSAVLPMEYNCRTPAEHEVAGSAYCVTDRQPIELHGHSCFLRDGDTIYHTYSTHARSGEALGGSRYYLDLTALGLQDVRERPGGRPKCPGCAAPDVPA